MGHRQANHIHLLLAKGKKIFQEFFPELEQDLVEHGANKIDFLNDSKYLLPSGWAQRFNSGMITFTCTRTLSRKHNKATGSKNSKNQDRKKDPRHIHDV